MLGGGDVTGTAGTGSAVGVGIGADTGASSACTGAAATASANTAAAARGGGSAGDNGGIGTGSDGIDGSSHAHWSSAHGCRGPCTSSSADSSNCSSHTDQPSTSHSGDSCCTHYCTDNSSLGAGQTSSRCVRCNADDSDSSLRASQPSIHSDCYCHSHCCTDCCDCSLSAGTSSCRTDYSCRAHGNTGNSYGGSCWTAYPYAAPTTCIPLCIHATAFILYKHFSQPLAIMASGVQQIMGQRC